MLNRLIAITAAAMMVASTSSAMAGLVGLPMNLKLTMAAAHDFTNARIARPLDVCTIRTDDVLTGPFNAWIC